MRPMLQEIWHKRAGRSVSQVTVDHNQPALVSSLSFPLAASSLPPRLEPASAQPRPLLSLSIWRPAFQTCQHSLPIMMPGWLALFCDRGSDLASLRDLAPITCVSSEVLLLLVLGTTYTGSFCLLV